MATSAIFCALPVDAAGAGVPVPLPVATVVSVSVGVGVFLVKLTSIAPVGKRSVVGSVVCSTSVPSVIMGPDRVRVRVRRERTSSVVSEITRDGGRAEKNEEEGKREKKGAREEEGSLKSVVVARTWRVVEVEAHSKCP
jgi:hypothetical protein